MPLDVAAALRRAVEGFFNKATKVVNTMGLQDDLRSRGFTHLKVRSFGRYDLNPPVLDANRYSNSNTRSSIGMVPTPASSSSSASSASGEAGEPLATATAAAAAVVLPVSVSTASSRHERCLAWLFDGKSPPWMPVLKQVLGDDCVCIASGCMLSLPGSQAQPLHQDGPHLSKKVRAVVAS